MGFDKQELQDLEAVFLLSRNPDDLQPLYEKLLHAGYVLLNSYTRGKGLYFTKDRRDIIVHDATCRLLEMYLKHPNQTSIPLSARMYLEIIHNLHDRKQIIADKLSEKSIPLNFKVKPKEVKSLSSEHIEIISSDSRIKGKDIVVDLYRFSYYKRAILAIEKYTPRYIIYEYATELRSIWETLHKGGNI